MTTGSMFSFFPGALTKWKNIVDIRLRLGSLFDCDSCADRLPTDYSVVQWHPFSSLFFGGCPAKNGLAQKGFPCFSRVTEQLRRTWPFTPSSGSDLLGHGGHGAWAKGARRWPRRQPRRSRPGVRFFGLPKGRLKPKAFLFWGNQPPLGSSRLWGSPTNGALVQTAMPLACVVLFFLVDCSVELPSKRVDWSRIVCLGGVEVGWFSQPTNPTQDLRVI